MKIQKLSIVPAAIVVTILCLLTAAAAYYHLAGQSGQSASAITEDRPNQTQTSDTTAPPDLVDPKTQTLPKQATDTQPTPAPSSSNSTPTVVKPPTASAPNPPVHPPAITQVHDVTIPPVIGGLAPVISRLVTKQPVVFLGIDDGISKQPLELQLMKDNKVKASLFLTGKFIKDDTTFFKDFVTAGSLVEDHTVDHKLLSKLTYDEQKQEICDEADLQTQQFGRRPVLFRPPGGDYNQDTRRAAAACGMKAVVQWIAKANGSSMQYQIGQALRPGDIVLMHFRPEFKADMRAFLDAQNAAGLHTELLENWLP